MVEWTTALSRIVWQAMQVRTPGSASRRFLGICSPQSSHSPALSPWGVSARRRSTASFTVSSICCSTAPSRVHPPAMANSLFLHGRNIGMEGAARNRRGDRALKSVLADRRDAEHPIVDANVGEDYDAAASRWLPEDLAIRL